MRDEMIPLRFKQSSGGRRSLAGLGDLVEDYQTVILTIGDSANWLSRARGEIYGTGAASLIAKWRELMLHVESLRQRAAAIHYKPSVIGFIENIFGSPGNVPIIGSINRAVSSDMAVYTADAQQFIADVSEMKLSLDQYKRLIKSGVSKAEASNTLNQSSMGFFERLFGKAQDAVKGPAYAIGGVAIVALLIIYAPQIKTGLLAFKSKIKK